mgnify:CR=1 FL=1
MWCYVSWFSICGFDLYLYVIVLLPIVVKTTARTNSDSTNDDTATHNAVSHDAKSGIYKWMYKSIFKVTAVFGIFSVKSCAFPSNVKVFKIGILERINLSYTDNIYTVSIGWMVIMQNLNLKFNFCTHAMNQTVTVYTLLVYIRFIYFLNTSRFRS